jgi:hypothetical protein
MRWIVGGKAVVGRVGLPELPVASHISRLASRDAAKSLL